jgi:hypothetical protein
MDEPRQSIAIMMSGLGIHYDLRPDIPCSDGDARSDIATRWPARV